jgi:DNA-binding IclR family transcriptional regulator
MAAFADIDLVKVAQPAVESLKLATEETADLAVLDGPTCVTYLCKSESPLSIRVQFWVGMRTRSWRSATGRAMLAFLPHHVEELLKSDEAIADKVDRNELRNLLRKIERVGFAVTKGDNNPEMGGIAAPVRDHTGLVIASCGIAVPRYRMTTQLINRCVPEVLSASARISADLGYRQSA